MHINSCKALVERPGQLGSDIEVEDGGKALV